MPLNIRLAAAWNARRWRDRDRKDDGLHQSQLNLSSSLNPISPDSLQLSHNASSILPLPHSHPHASSIIHPHPPSSSSSSSSSYPLQPSLTSYSNSALSPPPLPPPPDPQLTIVVIHLASSDPSARAKVDARLTSTAFKLIHQQVIQVPLSLDHPCLSHLSPKALSAFKPGPNSLYLVERPRAIQVCQDVVGHSSGPPRPGSLRAILGQDVIWAPDSVDLVYEFLLNFWPHDPRLLDVQFAHLRHPHRLLTFPVPSITHPSDNLPSPIRPEKRIFKFSRNHLPRLEPCCPSPLATPQEAPLEPPSPLSPLSNPNMSPLTNPDQPESNQPQTLLTPTFAPPSAELGPLAPHLSPASSDTHSLRSHSTRSNILLTPSSTAPPPLAIDHSNQAPSCSNETVLAPSESFSHNVSPKTPSTLPSVHPQHLQPSSPQPSQHTVLSSSTNSLSLRSDHDSEAEASAAAAANPPKITQTRLESSSSSTASSSSAVATLSDRMALPFRARPLPASTAQPTSQPRMSKAATLRLGLPWSPPVRIPPPNVDPDNYPVVQARVIPAVASLNPPFIAPRPTRASALRTDGPTPSTPTSLVPSVRVKRRDSEIYENVPGHNFRRQSLLLPVASIASPKYEPRPTRASALRTGATTGLSPICTSADRPRGPPVDFEGVPGHPRTNQKFEVKSTSQPPEVEVRPTKASLLRAAGADLPSAPTGEIVATSSFRSRAAPSDNKSVEDLTTNRKAMFEGVPGHKRAIPVPVPVLQRPPTTEPRSNRAAKLRAGGGVGQNAPQEGRQQVRTDMDSPQNTKGKLGASASRSSSYIATPPSYSSSVPEKGSNDRYTDEQYDDDDDGPFDRDVDDADDDDYLDGRCDSNGQEGSSHLSLVNKSFKDETVNNALDDEGFGTIVILKTGAV